MNTTAIISTNIIIIIILMKCIYAKFADHEGSYPSSPMQWLKRRFDVVCMVHGAPCSLAALHASICVNTSYTFLNHEVMAFS